jgi:hypothetical protein
MKEPRIRTGIYVLLTGILCNGWMLGILFSPGGTVTAPWQKGLIWGFDFTCCAAGVFLILSTSSRFTTSASSFFLKAWSIPVIILAVLEILLRIIIPFSPLELKNLTFSKYNDYPGGNRWLADCISEYIKTQKLIRSEDSR